MRTRIFVLGLLSIIALFINSCKKLQDAVVDNPAVNCTIDSTTDSSCTVTGLIINTGNPAIVYQGICWGTSPNPVIDSNTIYTIYDTTFGRTFSITIPNLKPRTTYYARAFAINKDGIKYKRGPIYSYQVSFTTPTRSKLRYGQMYDTLNRYLGGYIFYLDTTGYHGFVCDTTDLGDSTVWLANVTDTSGATGTAIGTGASNTSFIFRYSDSSYTTAVGLCVADTNGGFHDWFLPSKDELNQLYLNLTGRGAGNMAAANYWSSSDYLVNSSTYAWAQYFGDGNQYYFYQFFPLNVRAIRAF